MTFLLKKINDRAEKTFNGEFTVARLSEWYAHWEATAKAFRDEVFAEGLVETAKALDAEIAYQQTLMKILKE